MSTIIIDTITGKSTATTVTIGSTPVVSASANSMTIRGEGTAQTSIQQGLAKVWYDTSADGTTINDSFNVTSMADTATGRQTITIASDMGSANYAVEVQVSGNLARFRLVQSEAAGSVETGVFAADASGYTDGGQHVTIHGDLA